MSLIYLRYATASQEIPLGRFVDSTDGDTEETGLTIANTDIKLWKTGATTLASKNSGGATHISNGVYYCTLDATDTNTLGSMVIHVHVSGALYVKQDCVVLPAVIYDSIIAGTDLLQVDATQWKGTALATVDTAGYPKVTVKSGTGTGEISLASGRAKADVTYIAGSIINTASAQLGVNVVSQADIDFGATQKASIGTAITGNASISSILADTNELQTDWVNGGRLDLLIDSILADTNELQTDWVNGGRLDLILDELTTQGDTNEGKLDTIIIDTNELQTDLTDGGRLDLLIDSILSDTNELQTDLANGGRLDLLIDSILADTNELQTNQGNWLTATGFATEAKQDIIDGIVDSILADTNELQTNQGNWTTASGFATETKQDIIDGIVDTIVATTNKLDDTLEDDGGTYRFTTNALEQAPTGGSAPTVEQIRQEMDANSTQLAAIVADTNEIQTDLTNGGRLDLLIDSILEDTNELQTNQGNWLTATGFSTHSAADVWAVVTRTLTAGTRDSEIDSILADTNELQTDLVDGGRLDLLIDSILTDTNEIQGKLPTNYMMGSSDTSDKDDEIDAIKAVTDTLSQIGQIINIMEMCPKQLVLNNTSPIRIGIRLVNSVDDLPGTAEINPGTYIIQRKPINSVSGWTTIANGTSLEAEGLVYVDEDFTSGAGYAEGDHVRVGFLDVSVTADGNTYQVVSAGNYTFIHTVISQTMRGTDSAYTGTPPTTEEIRTEIDSNSSQLSLIVADTNELQTNQGNWLTATGFATATNQNLIKAVTDKLDTAMVLNGAVYDFTTSALQNAPSSSGATAEEVRIEMDANSTKLISILADTNELQTDFVNGGRLDLLIDAILTDTNEIQDSLSSILKTSTLIDGLSISTILTDLRARARGNVNVDRTTGTAAFLKSDNTTTAFTWEIQSDGSREVS